jgi:hypothetical protein
VYTLSDTLLIHGRLKMNYSLCCISAEENMDDEIASQGITYIREDGSIIPEEELAEMNPVNLLAAAVNLAQQQPGNQASQSKLYCT